MYISRISKNPDTARTGLLSKGRLSKAGDRASLLVLLIICLLKSLLQLPWKLVIAVLAYRLQVKLEKFGPVNIIKDVL